MERGTDAPGATLVIKGDVTATEDLTITGRVEGTIQVPDHVLTLGRRAHVAAAVSAGTVVVGGQVAGDVTATEKVVLEQTGVVDGTIVAPVVAMADGACVNGRIDTTRPGEMRQGSRRLALAV